VTQLALDWEASDAPFGQEPVAKETPQTNAQYREKSAQAKLWAMADSLQGLIDKKRQTHAQANLTHKRLQEQQMAFRDADRLEAQQTVLRALAEPNRPCPPLTIRNKAQVETLIVCTVPWPLPGERPREAWTAQEVFGSSRREHFLQMGIQFPDQYESVQTWVQAVVSGQEDSAAKQEAQWKAREKELAMQNIPGFFPTPPAVVARLLERADIGPNEPRWTVLEPSAGSGALADAIRAVLGVDLIQCVEYNYNLAQLLKDKGYRVHCGDFLEWQGLPFDRIVMNPPFEKGQDARHVQHAYSLLGKGGRLVSVMASSVKSSQTYQKFRDWLAQVGGEVEDLPADSFKASLRSTGTQCVLVTIDKEEE
jgi:predicted RNA methylase